MRPPDIFIASGATKSHFMEVFEKLRIHVGLEQILMALSQIKNLMENTVHSWKCVKWQLFFPYVPFLSKCLLVSERATLWKISTVTSVCSHPLCDTQTPLTDGDLNLFHEAQPAKKPNTKPPKNIPTGKRVLNFLTLTYDLKPSFPFLLS